MCVDRVMTTGSLGGVIVRTLVRNARDVGSNSALGAIFPHLHYPVIRLYGYIITDWRVPEIQRPCRH